MPHVCSFGVGDNLRSPPDGSSVSFIPFRRGFQVGTSASPCQILANGHPHWRSDGLGGDRDISWVDYLFITGGSRPYSFIGCMGGRDSRQYGESTPLVVSHRLYDMRTRFSKEPLAPDEIHGQGSSPHPRRDGQNSEVSSSANEPFLSGVSQMVKFLLIDCSELVFEGGRDSRSKNCSGDRAGG